MQYPDAKQFTNIASKFEIKHIQAQNSNATDEVKTFDYLKKGSYKHYWSFDNALKNLGQSNGCNLGTEEFGDKYYIYSNN